MAVADQLGAIPPTTKDGATGFQFRSTGSIASGGLTIPKRVGHRRTLIDLFFEPLTAGIFLDIQIGERTYVRLPTSLGDFVSTSPLNQGVGAVLSENLKQKGKGWLWYLKQFVPFDFPTATQDEDIIITPVAPLGYGALPASFTISAYYGDDDHGDVITKTVPGGSFNARRLSIDHVTNGLAQAAAGQTALDTLFMPKGLLGFKDSDLTPAGTKFTAYIYYYDASALGTTTGVNANGKPTRLHIVDVDTELYEPETTEGLLLDRDIGNQLSHDLNIENLFYPLQPYFFDQNHKIRLLLDTAQKAGTGANFAALTQALGIIGIREPIA